MTGPTEIQILLKAWARWHVQANGYPPICPQYLSRDGSLASPPGSRPPRGVEIPQDIAQLVNGMHELSGLDQQYACAIGVVVSWYLRAHNANLKAVSAALQLKPSTYENYRRSGEKLIEGWMAAANHHYIR